MAVTERRDPSDVRSQSQAPACADVIREKIAALATALAKTDAWRDPFAASLRRTELIDEFAVWSFALGFREARTQYDAIVEQRIAEVSALIGSR